MSKLKQNGKYEILPDPKKSRLPPFNPDNVPKLQANPYNNFIDVPRTLQNQDDVRYYMKKYKTELFFSAAAMIAFIIYKKINR